MENKFKNRAFFGGGYHLILAGIAAIPIFMIMHLFTTSMQWREDDATATALTIVVIGGIFAGRYIGNIWAFNSARIRTRRFVLLILIALLLTFWIFFYSEFPLHDRLSLSIMLFSLPLFALSVICGVIIKLIRSIGQKQVMEARSSAAHSQSELQLLQSQISPHFLFNTLNNMYGLSISQHEKIPPLLLKLSDLLRYSVYDANKSFVPVSDELSYIRNYIDFEKMRIGERLALTVEFDDFSNSSVKIAPMLLVVFVENAFKHSKNTTKDSIFIHMSLKSWENRLLFSIVNSYSKSERPASASEHSGFGLENVRKRLDMLYPFEHHLVIEDSNDTYKVMLQVKSKS